MTLVNTMVMVDLSTHTTCKDLAKIIFNVHQALYFASKLYVSFTL